MDLIVTPSGPLRGELKLPGDKSLSHRTALFAALADGESRIKNFLMAGVTEVMLRALTSLDVIWKHYGDTLVIQGVGLNGFRPPASPIDCGHSATTLRFLAGGLAAAGLPAVLDGSPGLRRRPMGRVVTPLQEMGVPIEAGPGGRAPLKLAARAQIQPLRAIEYHLPVASAQVKTALLLAGLASEGPVTLHEPGPTRDHTERLLKSMGVRINAHQLSGTTWASSLTLWPPTEPLAPIHCTLPGDFSSAAFIIAAALIIPGSEVLIRGVGLNPTRTGLLDALQAMGADIRVTPGEDQGGEPVGDLIIRHSPLVETTVQGPQVVRMIDEFPIFGVLAAYARGVAVVRDARELRLKESDRIATLCAALGELGVKGEALPDGFKIAGGTRPTGGHLNIAQDHRLAMSMVVAGLGAEAPVVLRGAEIIHQSFPGFVEAMNNLGAEIAWLE